MLKESRLMELMGLDFSQCRGHATFRLARIALPLAMLASLSACSYLSGGAEDPGQPKKDSILENIVMGGARPQASATPQIPAAQARFPDAVTQQDDFDCPVLDVAANGATLRDFAGGNDSGALRHQVSITRLARECKDAGANIAMKLGVEGSVLLGPSGSPGTFKVPLVFEARLKDKVVASRSETVTVTIPPSEERAFYSTVLTDFVIPKDDDVDVYVGLNQGGGEKLTPPKERRHRKRR
jgi:hypothetical protein